MRTRISEKALSLGFSTVGFTAPFIDETARAGLQEFIENQYHGDMGWMENNIDRRADPSVLWPEAKSVVVVGHNYGPDFNPMEKLADTSSGNISCYALNEDYHDVMKKKLRELASWIAKEFSCDVKLFVDTAPVMEKPLAEAARLGWVGKHTCLVSREFGSWLFLGSVFLSCDMSEAHGHRISNESGDPAQPPSGSQDLCGSCTRCLDVCPTGAFTAERQIDARRCISYLTIENKGQIPLEFRRAIGNRIYGCDDCLAVCPWNKFAETAKESAYHARAQLRSPALHDLLTLDDTAFRGLFRKSPVKRIGRDRFIRNVLVAAGNSQDSSLVPLITPLQHDASPLVAEMATWALGELQKSPI